LRTGKDSLSILTGCKYGGKRNWKVSKLTPPRGKRRGSRLPAPLGKGSLRRSDCHRPGAIALGEKRKEKPPVTSRIPRIQERGEKGPHSVPLPALAGGEKKGMMVDQSTTKKRRSKMLQGGGKKRKERAESISFFNKTRRRKDLSFPLRQEKRTPLFRP